MGNVISKVLKESNKNMWPSFPTQFGIYSFDNYKHEIIEIKAIRDLGFPTITNIQYDPHQLVKNITIAQSIRKFVHEPDKFDDLFEGSYSYSMVAQREEQQLTLEEMNQFTQYKISRLEKISLDSLQTPQEKIVLDDVVIIGSTQSVDPSQPRETIASSSSLVEGFVLDARLKEIQEEYNQALNSKSGESQVAKTPPQMKVQETLKNPKQTLITTKFPKKPLDDKFIEIIPDFPFF